MTQLSDHESLKKSNSQPLSTNGNFSSCPMNDYDSTQNTCPNNFLSSCPISGDPLNPSNLMPSSLSPSPTLPPNVSNERIISSIQRTGSSANWQYPSPAMFYSAVERKGHSEAITNFQEHPVDLDTIVHIHNIVNEKVWQEILKYENLHLSPPKVEDSQLSTESTNTMNSLISYPTLTKFVGKAKDVSPKARLMNWFGYQLPFDRHDWYIDRNGKTVRYIIDFYSGSSNLSSFSSIHSSKKTNEPSIKKPSIYLDVRPALTFEGLVDRIKLQMNRYWSIF